MTMDHDSSRAKQQMITELRAHCCGRKQELAIIEKFKRLYCPADAILWYTKPCFLHRLVNSALRTGDALDQYTFRYFIVDMCKCLEKAAVDTRTRYTVPFSVYRGAQMCRDEVEKFHVGTLVATNGFLSSSQNLDVAQQFIGIDTVTGMSPSRSRKDLRQYVLFNIDVDLTKFPDTIVADVAERSTVPDENEVIFDIGTTFIITDVMYDAKHYLWHIRMTLSLEVAQLHQDYTNYIRTRLTEINGVLLFGNVLADMLGEHNRALSYFHRLLRTVEMNDENRPNIYFHLARIYRYIKKYQQAITYYRCAQLLQRRRLPQSNFDYARTLSGLGVIYLEMGNTTRAISLLKQGLIVKRRVVPEDHLENAHIWNRLAEAYWQEKQYESAVVLLMKSLSFFKRKMPTGHPAEAQSLHILGLVQHALGNREEALQAFQQALRIRETFLSNDALVVGETCYELSVVHSEREEEYPIAFSYAQRALHIFQSKLLLKDTQLQRVIQLVDRLSQQERPD
jgi:tetratricopeptide (TPR) repeat protein